MIGGELTILGWALSRTRRLSCLGDPQESSTESWPCGAIGPFVRQAGIRSGRGLNEEQHPPTLPSRYCHHHGPFSASAIVAL